MSDNEAPKDYSLAELESWIWDALENGCSSQEIYDTIKSTVLKCIKFHSSCYKGGKELFELLSHRPYSEVVDDLDKQHEEWRKIEDPSYPSLNHNPEDFKLDSPHLHNDVDVE